MGSGNCASSEEVSLQVCHVLMYIKITFISLSGFLKDFSIFNICSVWNSQVSWILKFRTLFLFLFSYKSLVFRAEMNKMLVRIANREYSDQTASLSSLMWVCTVCQDLSGRQLVFEVLVNILKFRTLFSFCSQIEMMVFRTGMNKCLSE